MSYTPSTRNPATSVFNASETSLAYARAAVARSTSGGADLKIRCLGDSITAGQSSTAPGNPATGTSYPARMRQRLATSGRFGTIRTGPTYLNDATNAQGTRDTRISAIGTGWTAGANGWGGGFQATAPSGTLDFTPDQNVDTFVVTWARYAVTASLTFQVDGGSTTTQSINGSAAVGVSTIPAGSVGAHVLHIGATGAQVFVESIDAYDSTQGGGVRISKAGAPGASTTGYAGDLGYAGLSVGWTGWLPDIDLIHLGTNDAANSWNQASYITALTTLVTRARTNFCDPVILVPIPTGATYGGANHPSLAQACYAVAAAKDCMLIDLDKRWGSDMGASRSVAPFNFYAGDTHCTDKGYADMGAAVANALLSVL